MFEMDVPSGHICNVCLQFFFENFDLHCMTYIPRVSYKIYIFKSTKIKLLLPLFVTLAFIEPSCIFQLTCPASHSFGHIPFPAGFQVNKTF